MCVRELLRHSTDDVCARGRYDARRGLRCRQDAEVDAMASVKGDEMHRDDAMREMRDMAQQRSLHFNYTNDAVELPVSPERGPTCTSHTTTQADGKFCIRRTHY